jgi:hypothetical protein
MMFESPEPNMQPFWIGRPYQKANGIILVFIRTAQRGGKI